MRLLLLFIIFVFCSCHDPNYKVSAEFKKMIPDTSKTWAGRMTKETFIWTRTLQARLQLDSLEWGTKGKEIRVWHLSGSYDPQVVQIIRQSFNGDCSLRIISFNHSKGDSIEEDIKRKLRPGLLDSARIVRFWTLPSQSEMANGDTYGCLDGSDLFIELSTSERYKILWYRCPYINKDKNSAFQSASDLTTYINENITVR